MTDARPKIARILFAEETDPATVAGLIANGAIGLLDWGEPAHMIFVLVGKAAGRATGVAQRMNRIKGRPDDQVLAVAGFPELAGSLAYLEACPGLAKAAAARGRTELETLCDLFQFPVGVILNARPEIPPSVLGSARDGRQTVMLVGQVPQAGGGDFPDFNAVGWELASRHGLVMAASSANLTGEAPFSICEQESARIAFEHLIDFIVMRRNLPPAGHGRFVSSSVWDLTSAKPVLTRRGSKRPDRFKTALGDYEVADTVSVIPGAEPDARLRRWATEFRPYWARVTTRFARSSLRNR